MSLKKGNVATGATGQGGLSGRANRTELLSEEEFRDCFGIQNRVSVQLLEGDVVSTIKSGDNSICFSKEQFNAGLRLPLPSLFKQFLHYTKIPPALIHPNIVRVLMGCSVLDMLFSLDLSLLEVIFVYSSLPDSTKGAARGHVLIKGPWAGLMVHPDKQFVPNQSLKVPGMNRLLPILPRL